MASKPTGMHKSFSEVLGPERAGIVEKMDVTEVCQGLYLCAYDTFSEKKVRDRNITQIINTAREAPETNYEGVEYVHLPVSDIPSENIAKFFDHCCTLIHEKKQVGGNTLVHCALGISRSVTICLAYMIKHEGSTLRAAYFDIKKRRPIIKPNDGFWRQLIAYEQQIRGSATVKMIAFPMGSAPNVYQGRNGRLTNFR